MFGGETQEFRGDSKRTGSGVWESWRVVRLLHAQSLFTLHQAAANTHTHTHKEEVSVTQRYMKLVHRNAGEVSKVLGRRQRGCSNSKHRQYSEGLGSFFNLFPQRCND